MSRTDQKELALNIRKEILKMSYECGTNAHIGGALSISDILAVLYGGILENFNMDVGYDEKDKFILSKGHGAIALFAALAEVGMISKEQLSTFQQNGSDLIAHPVMNLDLGIESSNGSLGQGISMAVGLALAAKKKKKIYQTYTLVGNGECNEGIVWEAFATAVQFKLDNFTIIIDDNKMQSDGVSDCILCVENYGERLKSFGFEVIEVDGHDVDALYSAFCKERIKDVPRVIVANTIKGKGISFMENNNSWHHSRLTEELYENACKELGGVHED